MAFSFNMGSLTGMTKLAATDEESSSEGGTDMTVAIDVTVADPATLSIPEATTAENITVGSDLSSISRMSSAYVPPSSKTSLVSSITVGNISVSSIPTMFSKTTEINGRTIEKKTKEYSILSATSIMATNNAAVFDETNDVSLETINFFESLGCAVLDSPSSDYTLLQDQTDQTQLKNPNIATGTDLKKNRNGEAGQSTQDSFPSSDDPFYDTLSEVGKSSVQTTEAAVISRFNLGSKATSLASDVAVINTNKEYNSTLKQFKSPTRRSESTPTTKIKSINTQSTVKGGR